MNQVTLAVSFNGAFRIATGRADAGADDTVNGENPIPAASLKGVMRDASRELFPGTPKKADEPWGDWDDHPLVEEVFGGRGDKPCPWHFSDLDAADVSVLRRMRVKLSENRKVEPGAMFLGEEVHATMATATISQFRPIENDRIPLHLALLHVSARLVDGLGANRRRGLGWVNIKTSATDIELMVDLLLQYHRSEAAR